MPPAGQLLFWGRTRVLRGVLFGCIGLPRDPVLGAFCGLGDIEQISMTVAGGALPLAFTVFVRA